MKTVAELEEMASLLEATDDYRVLRRLPSRTRFEADDGSDKRIGIILDVETTGLDPLRDEIIELAMVRFEYAVDGRIFQILDRFEALREPSIPIALEITKITGITTEMVAGKVIDPDEVTRFAATANVVIAHNAQFDRRFVERAFEVFSTKPWACSLTQID